MIVSELIEKLKECDQDAVVVVSAFEDGDIATFVSTEHPSESYWKGDCPVNKDTKAITIG